jgi:uracil-DNA glycosylase family 4
MSNPLRSAAATALAQQVTACTRCDRLIHHCQKVAIEKRRAYSDWNYWGKPVPGFGDLDARIWIIGLAPGAHGANRTGRVFTGDRSGDFLFAALHAVGLANQPASNRVDDGLKLRDCYISAAVRCAPPGNKPTPAEARACAPFLDAEWDLLGRKRVLLALGRFAWDAAIALARRHGCEPAATPFGHGRTAMLRDAELMLIGSYHVSQQNTFTGRLTQAMLLDVLRSAMSFPAGPGRRAGR